ncbi:MAG: GAF domain-containing protein [Bacteroidales bacterium]|nr:GAF domain-containing protein [Bacteroidales bacterium]
MDKKTAKYSRLYAQARLLLEKESTLIAQMATINAILYHKMQGFFWVGFYFAGNTQLTVGPYQGPLACQNLPYPKGVCWAAIIQNTPLVVPDVTRFPNHIACDRRSKSEIVLPVYNSLNETVAVLDIDSDKLNNFNDIDLYGLRQIIGLINKEYLNTLPPIHKTN